MLILLAQGPLALADSALLAKPTLLLFFMAHMTFLMGGKNQKNNIS